MPDDRSIIEALQREVATYKHAFETTAADRDRLLAKLNYLGPLAHLPEAFTAQAAESSAYGRYWQGPTDAHRDLLQSSSTLTPPETFRALVSTGFVLQHGLVRRRAHVERLITWQIERLRDAGVDFAALDATMCELDILPEAVLFDVGNRRVSTDFLRFYEYFVRIRQAIPLPERPVVFEIGSGYGGLARIVRLHHPACALLLLDIEETLKGAEIYLRYAFPDAVIRYFTPANPRRPESGEIVLCRVEDSPALTGMTADIAINTWSFGEMPNRHIDRWFTFLNDENTTRAIFLVNHFMMPVCLQSPTARAQLQSAQWLSKIDGRWDIVDFEMHPGSHRSPFWRHCQQGVCIAARLFESEAARAEASAAARAAVREVYLEDWAQCSIEASLSTLDPDRQRAALLSAPETDIGDATVFNIAQAENVLGIVKDDIRFDEQSAFFRLWNDHRLTGSRASLRLLRVLLYLKWRPAVKNPSTGAPYSVISGEEYEFGSLIGNGFAGDPGLIVPEWLDRHLQQVAGRSA